MFEPPAQSITHVALIMDGNGRWGQRHGKSRLDGHSAGTQVVKDIVRAGREADLRNLTLFAFSSENWRRPKDEVTGLMKLLNQYLRSELAELIRHNIKLRVFGDLMRLPQGVQRMLHQSMQDTTQLDGMALNVALSYGGRDDLVQATKALARKVRDGVLDCESLTERDLVEHLWAQDIPDIDLLIRTGGEQRISNFLLWHLCYAEMIFTPTLWPDFTAEEFCALLAQGRERERRFGAAVGAPMS